MWVRALETRLGSIVGASGCFYAIRAGLHRTELPAELSRDFASAMVAREHGYRAVSVNEAVCLVPRTGSLRTEFRRKIRTMARGLDTLWYKRHLLNPFRHGLFAWELASHKLCRWLVPLTLPVGLVGLVLLSLESEAAALVLAIVAGGMLLGLVGMRWPDDRAPPRVIALFGFMVAAILAGVLAWVSSLRGQRQATWEPTRRTGFDGA